MLRPWIQPKYTHRLPMHIIPLSTRLNSVILSRQLRLSASRFASRRLNLVYTPCTLLAVLLITEFRVRVPLQWISPISVLHPVTQDSMRDGVRLWQTLAYSLILEDNEFVRTNSFKLAVLIYL